MADPAPARCLRKEYDGAVMSLYTGFDCSVYDLGLFHLAVDIAPAVLEPLNFPVR